MLINIIYITVFSFLIYLTIKSTIRGVDGKKRNKKNRFKENFFNQC